jgi:glycine cleavage system H protein
MGAEEKFLSYKRSRFAARFPRALSYTESHFWLGRQEGDLWRVGFTKFALRMLGEPVEIDFEVATGTEVETGQVVGWLEGFKAVTDLFTPMTGKFMGKNPALETSIDAVKRDPYEKGWLYQVEGTPGDDIFDADGYAAFLDGTIDRMRGQYE